MSNNIYESLSENFILVSVTLRQWTGKRTDKQVSAELEQNKHAQSGSARVVKDLMAGARDELKAVTSAQSVVRTYVNLHTLPWGNESGSSKNGRLLSTAKSLEFLRDYKLLNDEYEKTLQRFLDVYENRRAQAIYNLGDLANEADYPDVSELTKEFGMELNMAPIPEAQDFSRLAVPHELTELLAKRLNKQYEQAVQNAMHSLSDRVVTQLTRLVTATDKVTREENTNIRKSLLGNLKETVGMLASSNVTNSDKVAKLAKEIDEKLLSAPVDLKDINTARVVKAKAQKLLQDIDLDEVFYG